MPFPVPRSSLGGTAMRKSPLHVLRRGATPPFVEYAAISPVTPYSGYGFNFLPDGTPGYEYFTTIRHPYLPDFPVSGPDFNDVSTPQIGVFIPFGNPLPPELLPITWEILAGSLPPGLSLTDSNPSDNLVEISGTPTTVGLYGITVAARDADGDLLSTSAFGTFFNYTIGVKRALQVVNLTELKDFLETFIGDPLLGDLPGWDVSNGGILLCNTSLAEFSSVSPINYKGGWLACKAYQSLPDGYFSVFDDRNGTDIAGVGPVWTKSPGDVNDLSGDYSLFSGSGNFTGTPPPVMTLAYI